MGHIAVLELFLCYLHALLLATEVEVVAVVEGGVRGEGFCPSGGVVRAKVEAAVEGAGGIVTLIIYKSAHVLTAVVVRDVERSFDYAVIEGNTGIVLYSFNHACQIVCPIDVHIADTARNGVVAISLTNQS